MMYAIWERLCHCGLLVCHDYWPGEPGVVKAINEFSQECPDILGSGVRETIFWAMKNVKKEAT